MAIPLAIPIIAGVAAAAGGGSAGALDAGKNKSRASSFYDPTGKKKTGYDANASHYGGSAEASAEERDRMRKLAAAAGGRKAFQADYSQADADRSNAAQARGSQGEALDMMRQRAQGRNLVSQQMGNVAMQQAVAEQTSQAASARGPGGLALAQQQAAGGAAAAQQGIAQQTQIAGMQEQMAAEQAMFGAASGMRGQDYTGQGLAAGQAQFQTGMQQQNRALNDQRSMGYEGMAHQAQMGEMQARMQHQGMMSGSHTAADGQNMGRNQANAQQSAHWWDRAMGGGQGGGSTSDEAAKLFLGPGGQTGQAVGPATHDVMTADGAGMDVGASIRKHSDQSGAQKQSGGMGGMMLSDDRAKVLAESRQAYLLGRAHQNEQLVEGKRVPFAYGGAPKKDEAIVDQDLHVKAKIDDNEAAERAAVAQRAEAAKAEQGAARAAALKEADGKLDTWSQRALQATPVLGVAGPAAAAGLQLGKRAMSDEDAKEMGGEAGALRDAARALEGRAYTYKPEFTPGEQEPGEPNFGPTAQNLEKNPITATAVKKTPEGLRQLDETKLLKVTSSLIADQQKQIDELRLALGKGKR